MYRHGDVFFQQSNTISQGLQSRRKESHMLVDQQNTNILPLSCEPVESFFDGCVIRLAVDDEEVLLRIRWLGDMLHHYQHTGVI